MHQINFLLFFILIFSLGLVGCKDDAVYENNINLQNNEWRQSEELIFNFSIDDAGKPYNLFYNVRYANTYSYYNLYISYYLYDSTGNQISHKNPVGMDLFDPKSGKPLGSGLGDIFDYSIQNKTPIHFPMKGKYKMRVKQFMRQNPLVGIASFGISIEEINKK